MNPKISIIVPVYKVEPYLRKCIDSILAQTFKDLELLLIDDGSPDNCGAICEEYALMDSRIRVVHKENGGLSDARNKGLEIAKGDYVGFVDSDDWIEEDMYELLYNMCVSNNCEIANCTSTIYFKNRTVKNGTHPLTIHNREEAMKVMLEGKLYDEVVWTKLIKRDLLKNIRFNKGIIYEDTAFTYQVIHKSSRVCCIGAPKYHYVKRENSTMDQAVKNIRIDAVLIYEEMYNFMAKHYPKLINLVILKLANNALAVLDLITSSQNLDFYKDDYYRVSKILNRHFSQTIKLKDYPRNLKLLLFATKLHPLMYQFIHNRISRKKEMA
jgi:glycosyltransferase involved in cell wall biosynthesis